MWVDAPIGYIASMDNWFKNNNWIQILYGQINLIMIYHFIGKDISYFMRHFCLHY